MNFKIEDKNTSKAIKVHYDGLEKYETREKPITSAPQAKRKTKVKEQKNTDLNSSDEDDIIETQSSTDSESNLNTENQSEAEDTNSPLNVTNDTSENGAKETEQQTSKGQEKAKNVAEGEGATSSNPTEYTRKKAAKTKIPKTEKSKRILVVKQKVLMKRLIVIPRHQKWLQVLAAE